MDDATAAAAALDIALTARGSQGGEPLPMCGVPVGAAQAYLSRIIRRGFRVAIAEQTATPPSKAASRSAVPKSALPSAVVRLGTPGTPTEDELLQPGRSHLLHAPASHQTGRGQGQWRHRLMGRGELRP